MARDQRIIYFSEGELKDALFGYCRATGRKIADPAMTRLRVAPAPPITAVADGFVPGEATVFEEHDIAAALILYCRQEKIPLPRQAAKSLKLANGSIALCTFWETPRIRIHAADLSRNALV